MKCSACNFENSPNTRFCARCGNPMKSESRVNSEVGMQGAPVSSGPQAKPAYTGVNSQASMKETVAKPRKKANVKAIFLAFFQMLVYAVLAALPVIAIFIEKGVRVQSAFKASVHKDFSLFSIMTDLISGSERCNPTAISIIMGLSAMILVFACTFSWIVALLLKPLKKFHSESHVLALILTALNSISLSVLVPLAYRYSGVLQHICARNANMLAGDVKSVTSVWAFVFAGICVVLVIVELILASQEKKSKANYIKE